MRTVNSPGDRSNTPSSSYCRRRGSGTAVNLLQTRPNRLRNRHDWAADRAAQAIVVSTGFVCDPVQSFRRLNPSPPWPEATSLTDHGSKALAMLLFSPCYRRFPCARQTGRAYRPRNAAPALTARRLTERLLVRNAGPAASPSSGFVVLWKPDRGSGRSSAAGAIVTETGLRAIWKKNAHSRPGADWPVSATTRRKYLTGSTFSAGCACAGKRAQYEHLIRRTVAGLHEHPSCILKRRPAPFDRAVATSPPLPVMGGSPPNHHRMIIYFSGKADERRLVTPIELEVPQVSSATWVSLNVTD